MNQRLVNWGLIIIVLIGGGVRLLNLGNNPIELFSDEIINYVSAESIFQNGYDLEKENKFFFSDRVELRPPLYGYIAYVNSLLLPSEISYELKLRIPAVLLGILTLVLLYKLVFWLTLNQKIALISAGVAAILPWHIHYSRIGWEPASFLPFFVGALTLFLSGVKRLNKFKILTSAVFFGLSVYTYQAAIVYVFLFFICSMVLWHKELIKIPRTTLLALFLFVLILLPYFYTALREPNLLNRGKRISTFNTGINQNNLKTFYHNYIAHYKLDFLFSKGDSNLRHLSGHGVLYWWMLPFIVIGLLSIWSRKIEKRPSLLILFWFIVFPLAGALTDDGVPHSTRTIIGIPVFAVLTAIGLWAVIEKINLRKFRLLTLLCLSGVIFFSFARFWEYYFIHYPKKSAAFWQYGHKAIFNKIYTQFPGVERACLGNLDYWNSKPLLTLYASNSNIDLIDTVEDKLCGLPNTLVVTNKAEYKDLFPNDMIIDPDSRPLYYFYLIE